MSERNNDGVLSTAGPESAIFKSADHGPTKMNPLTNSAVSDVAVERAAEDFTPANFEVLTNEPAAPLPITKPAEDQGVAAAAKAAEEIAASMAKVEAAVQSIEERQAEISESFHKAEELLAEVNRVRDALTFNDDLRNRIERTISRTRSLRGNVSER